MAAIVPPLRSCTCPPSSKPPLVEPDTGGGGAALVGLVGWLPVFPPVDPPCPPPEVAAFASMIGSDEITSVRRIERYGRDTQPTAPVSAMACTHIESRLRPSRVRRVPLGSRATTAARVAGAARILNRYVATTASGTPWYASADRPGAPLKKTIPSKQIMQIFRKIPMGASML